MLHKSDFLEIESLQAPNGICITWLPGTERMSEAEFKASILAEQQAVEQVKPKVILADTLNMRYSIAPHLQEWHNGIIFPAFEKAGLQKLAILVSQDIFAQVSIEQLVDDGASHELASRYFDSREDALKWLAL